MAKKLVSWSQEPSILADDLASETLKSIDDSWDLDVAICSAMQQEAGYELGSAQVLKLMPDATKSGCSLAGVEGELHAWLQKPATKWLPPKLIAEVESLHEQIGFLKTGQPNILHQLDTPLLSKCTQKLALLTTVKKEEKKQGKPVVVDLTGPDAACVLLERLATKSAKGQAGQVDLNEFDKHSWLLPTPKVVEWEKVAAAIREVIGEASKASSSKKVADAKKATTKSSTASKGGSSSSKGGMLKVAEAEVWASFG